MTQPTAPAELSPAAEMVSALVKSVGQDGARKALEICTRKLTNVELASLRHNWEFWARPKQLPPSGRWRSWGFLSGRGFGKTRAVSEYVWREAHAGRAMLIGLAAQTEDKCIEIQVEGNSGLIATSPPWFKPIYEVTKKRLVWPNGSAAQVLTPEVPGGIRGPEFNLSWLTEMQSWPVATREEAHDNFMLSTRLGYSRIVWDATAKRRHPLLLERLRMNELDPERHVVVRGSTYENTMNLGDGIVEDLERKFAGTTRGREELGGEMVDDAEATTAKQHHIDSARRPAQDKYRRKAIAIDVAITKRASSDRTGLILGAVGYDDQGYVLRDMTAKYSPSEWANLVIDTYITERVSVVVVETNKGGDLVTQNIRSAADNRKLKVVVLGKHEPSPDHHGGVLFVREVYSRGSKEDRAQPVGIAYEKGRISHVLGASLAKLEDTLTTWVPMPGADSPDDLDALCICMTELLNLSESAPDNRAGFEGIEAVQKALNAAPAARHVVSSVLSRGGGIGRI